MLIVHNASFRRYGMTAITFAILAAATACKSRTVNVSSGALDTAAIRRFKTFSVMAPKPVADTVNAAGTIGNDRAAGVVMDMDPMLATSLVGRAIRDDITNAFQERGYEAVAGTPDFYVAYYAGTGHAVDTRSSSESYHTNGQMITTKTYIYPAGTIVVDVVDAKTDSLVWRGTALAQIPSDPNDYAHAIHEAVEKIVKNYPEAQH